MAEARFVAGQLMRVDMSEMFSPERVTSVCKQYGLIPGQAMDIKNGFDFDLTADRKKAWDSILQNLNSSLDRHLAPSSRGCKNSISTCTETMKFGWQNFKRVLSKPRDMLDCALRFMNTNEKPGVIFYTNILGWPLAGVYRKLINFYPMTMSREFEQTCASLE